MPTGVNVQASGVLTSWKEIASYLGKGVRTVQRWECLFGLPVYRPNERSKGIVYASREDLDRWLADHWSLRPSNGDQSTAGANEIPSNGVNGVLHVNTHVDVSHDLCCQQRQVVNELLASHRELVGRLLQIARASWTVAQETKDSGAYVRIRHAGTTQRRQGRLLSA
jgi:hypothetical protein